MTKNTNYLALLLALSFLIGGCAFNQSDYGRGENSRVIANETKPSLCVNILAQMVSRKKFKNLKNSADALTKIADDISLKSRMEAVSYTDPIEAKIQAGVERALNIAKKRSQTITDELVKEAREGVLSTDNLVKEWRKLETQARWKLWREDPTYFRNIEVLKVMENPGVNPIEIYSAEGYKSWKKAVDYLDNIRVGAFEISEELVSQTNRLVVGADKEWAKTLNNVIPKKWWWKGGGILRERQVRGTPDIITEDVYQKLLANDHLGNPGFVEVPYRGKGELCDGCRHGFIKYLEPEQVQERLTGLMKWANDEMDKIKNGSSDAMDPINLASEFQYNYVSIHPMLDGNGRTSKLLMDRILGEFNLPPPMLLENDWDIFYTKTEYASKIRQAVLRSVELHRTAIKEASSSKWLSEAPNPYKVNKKDTPITRIANMPVEKQLEQYKKWVRPNLRIKHKSNELYLGGQRYILQGDGFLYNPKGVPHVYNHQDKTIYPISQKSYDLYTEMGEFNSELALRRGINPSHKEVYVNHLRMLKDLDEGVLLGKNVENAPYSLIGKANKNNELFLHPWQKALFENAIQIDIPLKSITQGATKEQRRLNAFATLSTQRGGLTNFERFWVKGSKVEAGDIIAQYEWMDFQYWEYLEYARKSGNQNLEKVIWESREKLHAAGRELLSDYLEGIASLSKGQREVLEKDPDFALMKEYIKHSNLSQSEWSVKKVLRGDDKQLLLRADYNWAKAIGFIDETTYKNLFNSGGEDFVNHLRKLHSKWSEVKKAYLEKNGKRALGERQLKRVDMREILESNPELLKEHQGLVKSLKWLNTDYMLANIIELLESPYTHRGASEEYESVFVNMILHMTDYRSNKVGASFSTNPRLYVKKGDKQTDFPFVQDSALLRTRLHIVTVPKDYLVRNRYNTYLGQNEFVTAKGRVKGFLGFNPIKGASNYLNFKKSFDKGFLAKPVSDGTPEGNASLKDALKAKERLFIIDVPKQGIISDPDV